MDVEVDDELLADMESATDIETVKRQKTQVSTDPDIRYFLCLYRRGKLTGRSHDLSGKPTYAQLIPWGWIHMMRHLYLD